MSLFSLLRKPAWEHRDAARRADAAARDTSPELLQKLPDLARNDADAQVRLAALRRVEDLSLLGDRMRNDTDAGVRAAARQRYLQRLGDARVPVTERERVLRVEDDNDILAQLAVSAPEPELRQLALERVARPGLIAERCLKDPDPALRLWLLDRIDGVPALERIADAARKTDKTLARTARERAFALKLERGDAAASRERALAICDELDALRRAVASTARERADALQAEWNLLRERFDETMERRVAGYFTALAAAITAPQPRTAASAPAGATPALEHDGHLDLPDAPAPIPAPIPDLPTRDVDPALIALLGELEARADRLGPRDLDGIERRWLARLSQAQPLLDEERETERRFRDLAERLRAKFAEAARAREAAAAQIAPTLDALQTALDAGKLADARALDAELGTLRKTAGDAMPRALSLRMGEAARALAKLAEWQHWSNNKARARLCDEIEALASSGLHPDAVAVKVREAQAEWQRMDDSERAPGSGETPVTGLSRRFRALCHRAIAPTRAYFEKRHEVRAAKREEFDALLDEIDTRLNDTLSPPALIGVKRRIVDHLRRVDELEPKQRGELSRRLRAGLTRIDELLSAHEARAEAAKRKLLSNLKRELQHVDLDTALERARNAQAEWKQLGRAARGVDDALYQELKALTDPWFAQASDQQRAAAESDAAQQAEARAILDELAELAQGDAEALRAAESRIAALNARWRALTPPRAEPEARDAARRDGGARGAARGAADGRGPNTRGGERRDVRRDDRGPRTRDAAPRRSGPDERAYDRALEQVQAAQQRAKRERAAAELSAIRDASRLCDQLEALTADSPQSQRASLEERFEAIVLPGDAAAALKQRFDAARDPELSLPLDGAAGDAGALAEELVVRAELAAGVDTPADARELRRRWQVKRLAERLGGGATDSAAQTDEVRGLLIAFAGLRGVEPALRHALATRMDTAVRSVE
ncbi:hypothetical protein [Chiayiivirga flava]|uniref:DUF349 domain-containing protein n=1 Tax=Chiayiivirga flava TaxID=659595 RepID=A0A7W8G1D4_9GAMM|nr:hypothetical protein [Chiayiivirga flava]MBB5207530.1 hypothetical protein [Chiayiivirga flava]